MIRICHHLLAVTFALLAGANVANAQSAEAEALFAEGDRLTSAGKLAEACTAFEGSNRIEPRAGTLIRLGECRERTNQIAAAWSAYKDAVTRGKDPRKLQLARAKAAELEPRLSFLTISVPDESRVDGLVITRDGNVVDPVLLNRAMPIDGGNYVIGGRAPGVEEWRTSVSVPAERGKVSVEVPKFKEMAKLAAQQATPPLSALHVVEPLLPLTSPEGSAWTTRRKISIGVGGAAVVTAIAGVFVGLRATAKRDDAHALCPDPMLACADAPAATDLTRSAHGLSIGADIAFGAAGAIAIGAAVLWFTGEAPRSERVAVSPHVQPGLAGIAVSGSF